MRTVQHATRAFYEALEDLARVMRADNTIRRLAGSARRHAKQRFQTALARVGYELHRFGDDEIEQRRSKLIESERIGVVLDVGANAGQFASKLRDGRYGGRIVSFEPLSEAFSALERRASRDSHWQVHRLALGDRDGTAEINVAGNSWSSSLLPMGAQHLRSAPQSAYVGTESVPIARLDSIWDDLIDTGSRVWLKMDVQGFEAMVLEGALGCLHRIQVIQAELPLTPLYEGEAGWRTLVDWLEERSFALAGLEPGFSDPSSGRLLQFDGIFVRR